MSKFKFEDIVRVKKNVQSLGLQPGSIGRVHSINKRGAIVHFNEDLTFNKSLFGKTYYLFDDEIELVKIPGIKYKPSMVANIPGAH